MGVNTAILILIILTRISIQTANFCEFQGQKSQFLKIALNTVYTCTSYVHVGKYSGMHINYKRAHISP